MAPSRSAGGCPRRRAALGGARASAAVNRESCPGFICHQRRSGGPGWVSHAGRRSRFLPARPPAPRSEPRVGVPVSFGSVRPMAIGYSGAGFHDFFFPFFNFFFCSKRKKKKKLNNSGFIPMWNGKNFEILNIFEGSKTISHPVIATSLIRMCLKQLQQELSRAGLSWIPLSTRNAVVRGHVSSEKKYLQ